jgi:DNA-binding MarR family transcriptional regulator
VAYKLFNDETGEVLEVRKKKIKRTEPFFMMNLKDAAEIAKVDNLHGTEYKVLFFILSRIDYDNRAIMTQSFIAKELDMPQPQVSAAIKKLVESNVISKISAGGANGYMVSDAFASRGSLTK